MKFKGPDGLRYDTDVHDFVEENGELASVERIAEAWGESVESVARDRAMWNQLRAKRTGNESEESE